MDDRRMAKFEAALRPHLASLSPRQRDEELREIREHLGLLIERFRATGLDEPAATDAAIECFGAPDHVGREIALAHLRRRVTRYVAIALFALLLTAIHVLGSGLIVDPPLDLAHRWDDRLLAASGYAVTVMAILALVDRWIRRRHRRGTAVRFTDSVDRGLAATVPGWVTRPGAGPPPATADRTERRGGG